jgi:hypothetical protein
MLTAKLARLGASPEQTKKIWFFLQNLAALMGVVGGFFALYSYFVGDDYQLSVYQIDSQQVVLANDASKQISLYAEGQKIRVLNAYRYRVHNTGRRALTEEFIFDQLRLTTLNEVDLLAVKPIGNVIETILHGNVVSIRFDLLNSNDYLDFIVYGEESLGFKFDFRIKEISDVEHINFHTFKPFFSMLYDVHWFWYLILVFSFVSLIDSKLVLMSDVSFERVLKYIGNIEGRNKVNLVTFLDGLERIYSEHRKSAYCRLMKTEDAMFMIKRNFKHTDANSGKKVSQLHYTSISVVRFANLYDTRGNHLHFISLFSMAFIGIGISLFLQL